MKHMKHITLFVVLATIQNTATLAMEKNPEPKSNTQQLKNHGLQNNKLAHSSPALKSMGFSGKDNKKSSLARIFNAKNGNRVCSVVFPISTYTTGAGMAAIGVSISALKVLELIQPPSNNAAASAVHLGLGLFILYPAFAIGAPLTIAGSIGMVTSGIGMYYFKRRIQSQQANKDPRLLDLNRKENFLGLDDDHLSDRQLPMQKQITHKNDHKE